jgi:hypothetical protein
MHLMLSLRHLLLRVVLSICAVAGAKQSERGDKDHDRDQDGCYDFEYRHLCCFIC